jgi:hypothetical protein
VKKTRQVLEELQSNYHRLMSAIRGGKIRAPAMRDVSGNFWWTPEEIQAARQALSIDRRRKVVRS